MQECYSKIVAHILSSLIYHMESKTEKMRKRTKNKKRYTDSSEETVQVKVRGVSPEAGRESTVGWVKWSEVSRV